MDEREIGAGASCFLIKDERIIGDWYSTPIYQFLKDEGFICWGKAKSHADIDWLYINIYSKVYSKGMYGVGLTRVVGGHAITFEEFLTIYNIYKKYEGFSMLKMTAEEQKSSKSTVPALTKTCDTPRPRSEEYGFSKKRLRDGDEARPLWCWIDGCLFQYR